MTIDELEEVLKTEVKTVRLKEPIRVFNGYLPSTTTFGFIVLDKFLSPFQTCVFPRSTLVNSYNNAAMGVYDIENIGEYEIVTGINYQIEKRTPVKDEPWTHYFAIRVDPKYTIE